MKKLSLILVAVIILFGFPASLLAKTITASADHQKRSTETIGAAEQVVLQKAIKNAEQETSFYVRNRIKSLNRRLTEQETELILAHAVKITDKKFDWHYRSKNDAIVHCTVTVELDDNLDKYIPTEQKNSALKNENNHYNRRLDQKHPADPNNVTISRANAETIYQRGKSEINRGNYTTAGQLFKIAAQTDPDYTDAWCQYLECLLYAEDSHECFKEAKNMLRKNGDKATAYYYMGKAKLCAALPDLGQPPDKFFIIKIFARNYAKAALEHLQKAVDMYCNKDDLYSLLAIANLCNRDYDLAAYNCDYARQIRHENSPFSLFAAAKLNELKHIDKEAAFWYEKLRQKYPRFHCTPRSLSCFSFTQ